MLHPSLRNLSDCLATLNVELSVLGLALVFIARRLGPPAWQRRRCLPWLNWLLMSPGASETSRSAAGVSGWSRLRRSPSAAAPSVGCGPPTTVTHFVPGGGLMAHESANGHTLAKHVGQPEVFLRNRLAIEPWLDATSTFYNQGSKIVIWLSSGQRDLIISGQALKPSVR